MHARNQIDAFPTLQETVIPIDRIVVASANIIDLKGVFRSSKNDITIFDAEWSDDLGNRFALEEARGGKGYESCYRDYMLTVLDQFTGDPKAFYRYSSMVRRIEVCNERWRQIRTKQNMEEVEETLGNYVEVAIKFSEVENKEFLRIMADNEIYDPRMVPKLRRFGSRVVHMLGSATG